MAGEANVRLSGRRCTPELTGGSFSFAAHRSLFLLTVFSLLVTLSVRSLTLASIVQPPDFRSAETKGLKPGEVSTGTTIMAIPFAGADGGGVVMGADSRVSTGTYIANRVSDKIAQLHDHIFCCRSGSAADTQALTDYVKMYLNQIAVETGRPPTVKVAAHLMRKICYQNAGNLMAGVIVAGWDPVDGGSVYNIPLGGTMLKMDFAIGGSGSTYVYGLCDSQYKPGMAKVRGANMQYKRTQILSTHSTLLCSPMFVDTQMLTFHASGRVLDLRQDGREPRHGPRRQFRWRHPHRHHHEGRHQPRIHSREPLAVRAVNGKT